MQSVQRAPAVSETASETGLRSRLPIHTLFGALAVGTAALVLSHPAVMSMAGLDIASQRPGARMIDRLPTGTIAPVAQKAADKAHAKISGLVGLRAAIREQR